MTDFAPVGLFAEQPMVLLTRTDFPADTLQEFIAYVKAHADKIQFGRVANPEHAPYGRAAVAALRHEGLYERMQGKLVLGENISQAAQFAQTGSADAGLLALALALSPTLKSTGAYADIPDSWYPPIEQAACVLSASRQKALARQFVDSLKNPDSVRILRAFGFTVSP